MVTGILGIKIDMLQGEILAEIMVVEYVNRNGRKLLVGEIKKVGDPSIFYPNGDDVI